MADNQATATAAEQTQKTSHKRLLDPRTVTTRAFDAFTQLHPNITRLQCTPPYNILLLTPPTAPSPPPHSSHRRITCLLSGGGDGHFPAHAGYIGTGMLTAAVSGSVFASPSAEAVAAGIEGIRQTRPDSDVLLIVKNYTGDKLNFRLALHLLTPTSQQPLPAAAPSAAWTDMVVVGDDVALPRGQSIAGRRGLAGTLLVHKLAGAAAAEGRTGQQVKATADEVAARLCTLGVAFTGCSVGGGGGEGDTEMDEDEMELGLGLHGECGISRQKLESVDAIVRRMIDMLLSDDPTRDYFRREATADDTQTETEAANKDGDEARVILLVNNLSGMQQHELNVITQLAVNELTARQIRVERLIAGTLMTAWDMRGFSLTLLRLPVEYSRRQQWLHWFDARTGAPAWPVTSGRPPATQPPPAITLSQQPSTYASSTASSSASFSPLVVPLLRAATEALVSSVDELNALDSQSGDGDCGSTFKQGAELLLHDLHSSSSSSQPAMDLSSLAAMFRSLRKYSAAMGGTSGAICSLLFLAAASSLSSASLSSAPTSLQAVRALRSAADEVTRYSGAKPGDRTLLDALVPALDAAGEIAQQQRETEVEHVLSAAVKAGVTGMEKTNGMVARAGRASYVRAEVVKDVDPGAKAVCIVLQSMHQASQQHKK